MGTTPIGPSAVSTSRPSSFRGIGVYIASTQVVLVVTAVVASAFSYLEAASPPRATVGIAAAVLVGVLGAVALLTERRPDHRFSRWWRRPTVAGVWIAALILASVALATVSPTPTREITPTVVPLALAFRAIAAGSFWVASARVAGAAVICLVGSHLLRGITEPGLGEPTPTIAIAAIVAFAVLGQDMVYALALEIDDLRTTEAQRAVTHERQRFAGDLHDIQGQNLQLLAAEAQIVQRLIDAGRYPEAGKHATRLGQIAATAVDEMRSVVHAYRDVSVDAEASNAVRVLEAANISVAAEIDPPAGLADATDRLLGLTIREGITNVLRHTRARSCRLTVRREPVGDRPGVMLLLADSGPTAPQTTQPGSGIAELEHRYIQAGGRLSFTTTETAGSRLEGWLPLTGEGNAHR